MMIRIGMRVWFPRVAAAAVSLFCLGVSSLGGGEPEFPELLPPGELEGLSVVFDAGFDAESAETASVPRRRVARAAAGKTVRVDEPSDFPAELTRGRRIAVFLGGGAKLADGLRIAGLAVEFDASPGATRDSDPGGEFDDSGDSERQAVVELRFGEHVICRRRIRGRFRRSFFVPAAWFEKGMNILEIRNAGPGGVVFRGFRVSRFPALLREGVAGSAKSAEPPPAFGRRRGSAGLPREVARIADEVATLADSSRRMMEKAARGLPLKLTRMVEEGGGWFSVARLARREGTATIFCSRTRPG
jgi:hypothetical protein